MCSARKTRSDTGSTVKLAHTVSLGMNRDGSALGALEVSEDLARCTNDLFTPMTAAPTPRTAVSAIANRRQFLFAPIIIGHIHALIYAPTVRPADTCVILRSWFCRPSS